VLNRVLVLAAFALACPAEALNAAGFAQASQENCAAEDREAAQRNAPGLSPCRRLASPLAPAQRVGVRCLPSVALSAHGALSRLALPRSAGDILALIGTLRI